ncbi:carbohydrate ABC transporter permease [Cohnella lupini]|uniref:Putative aldouronate transport system permease protein n=1 Tax=Cohnella lupini TaxID=1294267 RepID=A0A3D9I476_9BACL|nr:carbohydrate ABC transporter permease [Cohnella lupini]RED56592.1 putative aldouronate transport system permease protein [Cohnella lupini]
MVQHKGLSRTLTTVLIYAILAIISLACLLPLINVLAVSFSSNGYATAGLVKLWPRGFTLGPYEFVLNKPEFLRSMGVSLQRVLYGVSLNMLLTVLIAYPLAKEASQFRMRTAYAWFFVFTTLFAGGLIPSYILVLKLHLIDNLAALVLPGAVPVFNVILLLNFFRSLPKEMSEAAYIDGAGHWQTLWKVYIPLSAPALATITLFSIVGHWNEWFNGLIYMNTPNHYPLSSYLQTVVVNRDLNSLNLTQELQILQNLSDRTVKAAQIFLGALPVLIVYPFLQRYFMTGIVMGSVKE